MVHANIECDRCCRSLLIWHADVSFWGQDQCQKAWPYSNCTRCWLGHEQKHNLELQRGLCVVLAVWVSHDVSASVVHYHCMFLFCSFLRTPRTRLVGQACWDEESLVMVCSHIYLQITAIDWYFCNIFNIFKITILLFVLHKNYFRSYGSFVYALWFFFACC